MGRRGSGTGSGRRRCRGGCRRRGSGRPSRRGSDRIPGSPPRSAHVRRQRRAQSGDHFGVHFDRGQVRHQRRQPQRQRPGPARFRENDPPAADRSPRPACLPTRLQEMLTVPLLCVQSSLSSQSSVNLFSFPRAKFRYRLGPGSWGGTCPVLETWRTGLLEPGRTRLRLDVLERFPAPVFVFDLFDLFLAQAEVVPELVDHRLGDADDDVLVVFAGFFDRLLVDRDAVGERVAVRPRAFRQRRALVQPEERVVRFDLELFEDVGGGSSSTTTATFFISWRKRGGISVSASSTSRVKASRVRSSICSVARAPSRVVPRAFGARRFLDRPPAFTTTLRTSLVNFEMTFGVEAVGARRRIRAQSGFGLQIRRPWRISVSDARVQSAGGSAAPSCCSTTSGSSDFAIPILLATRRTWRSTGRPGTPSAWPSTTFAVLRPTPGSFTSSSIVFGTSPRCCRRPRSPSRAASATWRGRSRWTGSAARVRRSSPWPAPRRWDSA